jgi:hypothetical protein
LDSAPAGLSRDEFYALIDKDLQAGDPSTWTSGSGPNKVVYDTPGGAQAAKLESGEIPSTYIGGFLKSLKDQVMTPGLKDSLGHAAEPESVGDFLSLLLPQGAMRASNLAKETELAGQASSRAQKGTGLINRVRSYWKGVGQDINTPTQTLGSGPHEPIHARDAELMDLSLEPRSGASIPATTPVTGGTDLYDTYKQVRPEPIPARRPAAAAPPKLDISGQNIKPGDKLYQKIMELSGESAPASVSDPRISGIPPSEGVREAGSAVGQAQNPEHLSESLAERFGMGKENPNPETIGAGPVPEPDALLQELVGGPVETAPLGQPRVKSWKPGYGPSAEDAGNLRDKLGARDAASILNSSEGDIKELAPRMNPRALPSDVRDRLMKTVQGMSPEDAKAYANSSSNDLVKAFINSIIGE